MSDAVAAAPRKSSRLTKIGLSIMAFATVWCMAYYGQWLGFFELFWLKFQCVALIAMECINFQDFIDSEGGGSIPRYAPVVFYLGTVLAIVGLVRTRRARS